MKCISKAQKFTFPNKSLENQPRKDQMTLQCSSFWHGVQKVWNNLTLKVNKKSKILKMPISTWSLKRTGSVRVKKVTQTSTTMKSKLMKKPLQRYKIISRRTNQNKRKRRSSQRNINKCTNRATTIRKSNINRTMKITIRPLHPRIREKA